MTMPCLLPMLAVLTVLTVLAALAGFAAPAAGSALFDAPVALPISYRPSAAELQDLDRDGDLDLVVLCMGEFANDVWTGCILHVFVNPGDGTFREHSDYAVPSAPCGLAIADLDGDADPDLVTANAAPDNLQVLLNDGGGDFSFGVVVPTSADPIAVVAADLDGDGDCDLASADQFGGGVTVARNLGQGSFSIAGFYPLGTLVDGLQAGDVDHDQDNDLIAFPGPPVLLRNNGAGVFGPAEPLGLAGVSSRAQLCLCNNDDHLDLVSGSRVWLGNGDGTFSASPILTGLADAHVRCLDFNRDGWCDVLTSDGIALGTSAGQFEPPIALDGAPSPGPLAGGDFAGDQTPDLVRLQAGVGGPIGFAVLLPGQGDGSVQIWPRSSAGNSVWALAADDVDDNLTTDLIVGNIGAGTGYPNGSVAVLKGRGDGSFDPLVSHPAGDYVRTARTGDLNGDGAPEIAATNFSAGTVSLLANDGAGGYGPRVPIAAGANPEALAFADFDGDGLLDVAVTNYGLGATPAAVTILYGDGAAGIASTQTLPLTGHAAVSLAAVDLDHDQWVDLAVACTGRYYAGNWTHYGLYLLFNEGGGSYSPEIHHETPALPRTVNACDVDRDEHPDLVVTTIQAPGQILLAGQVVTFFNDGAGNFSASAPTAITADHFAALCADCNGDDYPDLVLPYLSAGVVTILGGDGSGTFTEGCSFATGMEPRALALGDVNGDGDPDVAVAHSTINEVGVLLAQVSSAAVSPPEASLVPRSSRPILTTQPNPFSTSVRLTFASPELATPSVISLEILDVTGRCVVHRHFPVHGARPVTLDWNGCDEHGCPLPSGVYNCRLRDGVMSAERQIVLLK